MTHRHLAQRIIEQAISDLVGNDLDHKHSAEIYIHSERAAKDIKISGYPQELLDTVRDVLQRSWVQREIMLREVNHLLTTNRGKKKKPHRAEGLFRDETTTPQ